MGSIEDVEISYSIPMQKYFDSDKSVGKGGLGLKWFKAAASSHQEMYGASFT